MGGKNSVQFVTHVYPKGESHESFTNIFQREKAFVSYQEDERLSFGKCNSERLRKMFENTFTLIPKDGYIDGARNSYSPNTECCFNKYLYSKTGDHIQICPIHTKNYNSDGCDETMYQSCFFDNKHLNNYCTLWIRSMAQLRISSSVFSKMLTFFSNPNNYNHKYISAFITALRDFADEKNNYNFLVDEILNNYSDEIKKEFPCAFPSKYIIEKEKELKLNKECWYKECVLSPIHKLKTSNIQNRDLCQITICDININQLNMNTQDIKIICNNKFTKNQIDIEKNNPIIQDIDNFFFIPTFKNVLLPTFTLLFFIYLKN